MLNLVRQYLGKHSVFKIFRILRFFFSVKNFDFTLQTNWIAALEKLQETEPNQAPMQELSKVRASFLYPFLAQVN